MELIFAAVIISVITLLLMTVKATNKMLTDERVNLSKTLGRHKNRSGQFSYF